MITLKIKKGTIEHKYESKNPAYLVSIFIEFYRDSRDFIYWLEGSDDLLKNEFQRTLEAIKLIAST